MIRCIIFLLVFAISCGTPKNSTKDPHAGHTMPATTDTPSSKIALLMHQPMMEQEFQKTGNPDLDFLANMTPHHLGAILSAEEFLKVGKSPAALTLASNIIAAQQAEIAEFSGIIASLDTNSSYDPTLVAQYQNNSQNTMNQMMVAMSSVTLTENVDIDFLANMIPHHQGAINDAKNILTISTNDTIIEIANRIITDQEKEILEINQMLSTL